MLYSFECEICYREYLIEAKAFQPPTPDQCCGQRPLRLYKARIDTSGCRDHNDVPQESRVCTWDHDVPKATARRLEKAYLSDRDSKRKMYREGGGGKGVRQSHSIPAELYHGKKRETGDSDYWKDSSNVKKHDMWRVDK